MTWDVRSLLQQGNDKLSEAIFHWDLPASATCPGASSLCRSKCYALRRRYLFPQVIERLEWCYEMSQRKDFSRLMIEEIRRKGAAFVVRIHCAGDFYSAEYARKWLHIIRACPNTRFFGYSRSWRIKAIAKVLWELAELDNMRLWASADSETGVPEDLPESVRVAWMMVDEDEELEDVDLVFRDYPLRKERPFSIPLSLICPHELPQAREHSVNCGNCGRCWK